MEAFSPLTLITFLPFLGIIAILLLRGEDRGHNARRIALGTSIAVLVLAIQLCFNFDKSFSGYQFEVQADWMPGTGISYHLGVDGISVLFVLLTAVMTPVCILSCCRPGTPASAHRGSMVSLLLLESMLIGVFCAVDLVLFYIFFEGAMIPVFLLIGIRGGDGRIRAAIKLFLYTLVSTLLMLLAIMTLWLKAGSADLPDLMRLQLETGTQIWLFLAFLAAFGVKMPMWPVHTWQPDAYAAAPTAVSVMLGGVMLNMGAYGLLRFAIPLLPHATQTLSPLMFLLAAIAILYASFVAMAQRDMKRLIAYSSVAHMGIITIGLFGGNQQSISGALLQMLSHGVISGAMFLCIGVLQDRAKTRDMMEFGGLAKVMPLYAAVFMLFTMASVALPGTGDFPGEFLVIVGVWQTNPWLSFGISTTMVLGAGYMLYLYRKVIFGQITREELRGLTDLSPRELAMFAPLAVLTIWIGLYPSPFLDFFQVSVASLLEQHEAALAASKLAGL